MMRFFVRRDASLYVTKKVSKFPTFDKNAAYGKETHVQKETYVSYQ